MRKGQQRCAGRRVDDFPDRFEPATCAADCQLVHENRAGSRNKKIFAFKAGMLLKTKCREKTDSRIPDEFMKTKGLSEMPMSY
jgi:hypothetical protein